MSGSATLRRLEEERLAREAPSQTDVMPSGQQTTDNWATVGASIVDARDHNRLAYLVEEIGGSNPIHARVVGRRLAESEDGDVERSSWQTVGEPRIVSPDSVNTLTPEAPGNLEYDEYAVQVQALVGGSQGTAKVYGGSKLQQNTHDHEAVDRTAPMSSYQTTTDSYARISESELNVRGRNDARYVVEENGTNAIDARIVGRIENEQGGMSPWVPVSGADASVTGLSGSATELFPAHPESFDELAVEITANTGGSQGEAKAWGKSRHV
ncbi:MAG: hypothetical protein ABEN55_15535 [Bradymonadaceae bacterium]